MGSDTLFFVLTCVAAMAPAAAAGCFPSIAQRLFDAVMGAAGHGPAFTAVAVCVLVFLADRP